eukprot:COSAG05_NODE_224_length_13609_cov_26.220429_17_plen_147_part_00
MRAEDRATLARHFYRPKSRVVPPSTCAAQSRVTAIDGLSEHSTIHDEEHETDEGRAKRLSTNGSINDDQGSPAATGQVGVQVVAATTPVGVAIEAAHLRREGKMRALAAHGSTPTDSAAAVHHLIFCLRNNTVCFHIIGNLETMHD